jgi:hypothetical protein
MNAFERRTTRARSQRLAPTTVEQLLEWPLKGAGRRITRTVRHLRDALRTLTRQALATVHSAVRPRARTPNARGDLVLAPVRAARRRGE